MNIFPSINVFDKELEMCCENFLETVCAIHVVKIEVFIPFVS